MFRQFNTTTPTICMVPGPSLTFLAACLEYFVLTGMKMAYTTMHELPNVANQYI